MQKAEQIDISFTDDSVVYGFFDRIHNVGSQPYPAWRYHDVLDPKIVNNTQEDREASESGWKQLTPPVLANPQLLNWRWDFEEFSAKQLVIYARDEFQVELDVEAGKETLMKALYRLARMAPKNEKRMALMAQTAEMNYDETLLEIQRAIKDIKPVLVKEFEA